METQKKYDVFISYSRKDFDEVSAFVELLKKRIPELSIWFDLEGIESGDEFRDKIISAIKRSKYVLFALSIHSDQSEWTRKELGFAKGKKIKIVPILLKGANLAEMDWFLFEFGNVDCINIADEKQIAKLIKNIAQWTSKAISQPVVAPVKPIDKPIDTPVKESISPRLERKQAKTETVKQPADSVYEKKAPTPQKSSRIKRILSLAALAVVLCAVMGMGLWFLIGKDNIHIQEVKKPTVKMILADGVTYQDYSLMKGSDRIKTVVIGEGIEAVVDSAFYGCDSLRAIILTAGVKHVGTYIFAGCASLDTIVVEDNPIYDSRENSNAIIETASNTLVAGCGATVIPIGVEHIGTCAFAWCESLREIGLPIGMKSIGEKAFYGCNRLASVTLPEGVKGIGADAFKACQSLTQVNIPRTVETIGSDAFYNCISLTQVDIPTSVRTIGEGGFAYCSSLTTVNLGEGVETIGDKIFYNCFSLAQITLPNSLKHIGAQAFEDCERLTSIRFGGTREQWYAINKGKGWNNYIPAKVVQCSDGKVYI